MSRNIRKSTFGHLHPAKIQITLRIRTVWSESLLDAFWKSNDVKFLYADNEDWSDWLIWDFAGRTCDTEGTLSHVSVALLSCENSHDALMFYSIKIQSTLVISKSKGLYETLRDIRTSTYQICGTKENN